MITCEIFSHVYFAKPPESLSCAYLDSHVKFGCFQGLNWASKVNVGIRPVTSLGNQEGRRVSERGSTFLKSVQYFQTISNTFFQGGKNFLRGLWLPAPPLVGIRRGLGLYFRTGSMLQNEARSDLLRVHLFPCVFFFSW